MEANKPPIKIVDVIARGKLKYHKVDRYWVIVNRYPEIKYRYEDLSNKKLIGSDGPFHNAYIYQRPAKYSQAFGGREFDIPLIGGGYVHASGQWWDPVYIDDGECGIIPVGVNTLEGLRKMYVFNAFYMERSFLAEWLRENKPKLDYYFYQEVSDEQR